MAPSEAGGQQEMAVDRPDGAAQVHEDGEAVETRAAKGAGEGRGGVRARLRRGYGGQVGPGLDESGAGAAGHGGGGAEEAGRKVVIPGDEARRKEEGAASGGGGDEARAEKPVPSGVEGFVGANRQDVVSKGGAGCRKGGVAGGGRDAGEKLRQE